MGVWVAWCVYRCECVLGGGVSMGVCVCVCTCVYAFKFQVCVCETYMEQVSYPYIE